MSQSNGLRIERRGRQQILRGFGLACMLVLAGCERDPEDNLLSAASSEHTQPPAPEKSPDAATAGPSRAIFGVSADELLSYHGRGYVRGFEGRPYPPVPDRDAVAGAAADDGSDTAPGSPDESIAILNDLSQSVPWAKAPQQTE